MAINQFVNVTLDANSTAHPDRADYRNIAKPAASGASHFCISLDSAAITTFTQFDACVASARAIYAGILTP